MAFPLFSRFRGHGPPLDNRGQHLQRPPLITHVPRSYAAPVPQVHRGHHRHQHQSSLVPAPRPRLPAFWRRGPPLPSAQPRPAVQCLHIHFHGTPKQHQAQPPPRSSKNSHKQSHYPLTPSKGSKPPAQHVHWAPPQPAQRQRQSHPSSSRALSRGPSHVSSHAPARAPFHAPARGPARAPSHVTVRAPSHAPAPAPSHAPAHAGSTQSRHHHNSPPDSRLQKPRSSRGLSQLPDKRK
ncbi:hypothetical protein BS17DRAFT_265572 [Gyrodon lividus]|nr:hypothetical protein BS17DRAFT_265572 [Gyrodon lividus]